MEMPEEVQERLEAGIRNASAAAVKCPTNAPSHILAYATFVAYFCGWVESMCGSFSQTTRDAVQAVHQTPKAPGEDK